MIIDAALVYRRWRCRSVVTSKEASKFLYAALLHEAISPLEYDIGHELSSWKAGRRKLVVSSLDHMFSCKRLRN